MTRDPASTDDGPQFLSELLRDFHHLMQQQQAVEEKLMRLGAEQGQIRKRLDAVENTLRAIGIRENDLATRESARRAMIQGRNGALLMIVRLAGPLLVAVSSWVAIQLMFAVQHARMDELINGPPQRKPRQYVVPPVPQQLQGDPRGPAVKNRQTP